MTINHLIPFKLLSCISISLLISACSSSGGQETEPPVDDTPPQATEIELSGTAGKGVLAGAHISVHAITAPGAVESEALASTETDASGHYQLTLPVSAQNRALLVRAHVPDDGSVTMRCDLVSGCGDDVVFGEQLTVTEDSFTLSTLIPSLAAEPSPAHISVLTSVYSQMALDNLPSSATEEESALHFTESDKQLGRRFGLLGGVSQWQLIDITQAEQFSASGDVLSYNLLSSALIDAQRQSNPELSIGQALQALIEQFTREGIADQQDPERPAISMAQTLDAKAQLIQHIVERLNPDSAHLAPLLTETSARAAQAAMGSIVPSQGAKRDGIEQDHLAKAKAMIEDVRNLAHGGFLDQSDRNLLDQFGEQIDTVGALASPQAQILHRALNDAGNAFAEAWYAVQEQSEAPPAQVEYNLDSDTTLTVHIEVNEESTVYHIDQQIIRNGLDIALQLSAHDSQSSLQLDDEQPHADIQLGMHGEASSEQFSLKLESGQLRAIAQMQQDEAAESAHLNLTAFELDLKVTLTETEAHSENPLRFTGQLKLDLGNLELHASQSDDTDGLVHRPTVSAKYSDLQVLLSGEYANQSGERFASSFSLISKDIDYQWCSETPSSFSIAAGHSLEISGSLDIPVIEQEPSLGQECVWHLELSDAPQLSATYATEVGLAGFPDKMHFALTWSPIQTENQNTKVLFNPLDQLTLKLGYEDKLLSLEYSDFDKMLKAVNQDQVVLMVEQLEGDEYMGEVRYQDVPYATVSRNSNGLILVRFVDGTMESF